MHRLLPLAALSLLLTACASEVGDEGAGSSESAVVSSTKTFLVPVDARAREACHAELDRQYCAPAAAQRAVAACLARLGATADADRCSPRRARDGGCVRLETVSEPCAAGASGSAPVYPTAASCRTPRPRSCHFYSACLEAEQPCGAGGYALGYGDRYCHGFKNAAGFSAKGEAWRDNVMLCLQRDLAAKLAVEALSCAQIEDFAFASHPGCYTEPGHSICFLPPSDLAVVFSTIGLAEALDGRTQSQMRRVVGTCLVQTARWLFFGDEAAAPRARGQAGDAAPERALEADLALPEGLSAVELRERHDYWRKQAAELGDLGPAR